jgi:hypothetical protein
MRAPLPPSSTPSFTLADIERHAMPVETIGAPLEARRYGKGGKLEASPTILPPGTQLVNFSREVAAIWSVKYADPFPCNVILPDGRFLYLCVNVDQALKLVPTQAHFEWDVETQRYVKA